MKIKPIFAWYYCWVGLYWDQTKSKLYFLPVPMLGLVFDFSVPEGGVLPSGFESSTIDFQPEPEFIDKLKGTVEPLARTPESWGDPEFRQRLTDVIKNAYYQDPNRKV